MYVCMHACTCCNYVCMQSWIQTDGQPDRQTDRLECRYSCIHPSTHRLVLAFRAQVQADRDRQLAREAGTQTDMYILA